jgi:hypothetical protein
VVDQAIAGAFITEDIGGDVNVADAVRDVSSALYGIAKPIGVCELGQKPQESQACSDGLYDQQVDVKAASPGRASRR